MAKQRRFTALDGFNKVLLFVVLIFLVMHYAKSFLVPIATSALLAMLLVPVCRKLESWKFNRGVAAAVSVVVTLLIVVGVMYIVIHELVVLSKDMSTIGERLTQAMAKVQVYISEHFHVPIAKQRTYLQEQIVTWSNAAGKQISGLFFSVFSILGNLLIVTVYTILMLIYRTRIKRFVLKLVHRYAGNENLSNAQDIVEKITLVSSRYVAGVFLVVLILSVIYFIGLTVIGIENALFFAIIAALINIIPYIGSVAGGAIVVAYTLITRDTLTVPIVTTIFFTIVQQLDSYVLTPKITGGQVQLSPLFTIMVLLLGGMVWGVGGMVLFIPLLGVIKVVFDNVESLQPYGYLIGDK